MSGPASTMRSSASRPLCAVPTSVRPSLSHSMSLTMSRQIFISSSHTMTFNIAAKSLPVRRAKSEGRLPDAAALSPRRTRSLKRRFRLKHVTLIKAHNAVKNKRIRIKNGPQIVKYPPFALKSYFFTPIRKNAPGTPSGVRGGLCDRRQKRGEVFVRFIPNNFERAGHDCRFFDIAA